MNLHHLIGIQGRISRGEWWTLQILTWVAFGITALIYKKLGFHDAIFGGVVSILLFVFRLSLNAKRWHDRGKSAWWVLLCEIPTLSWGLVFLVSSLPLLKWAIFGLISVANVVGWLWTVIELGFFEGTEGENRFGKSPQDTS